MKEYRLTLEMLESYREHLYREERAPATIEKYVRDTRSFVLFLNGRPVCKERAIEWRDLLLDNGRTPVTVNAKLSALNGLFRFLGWESCRIRFLKIQRRIFRERSKELTREEYLRLLKTAQNAGQERLELLMEAICSTGIRVSEVRYLTVEAAQTGQAVIQLKGKIRTILLPRKLCRKLLKFAKKQEVAVGEIFLSKGGKSLSRKLIWQEMKRLCAKAGVEPSKVFPHNLRHLFATAFYRICRDIVKLADVLGHSSVETTRLYLLTAGAEHARYLEQLRLMI